MRTKWEAQITVRIVGALSNAVLVKVIFVFQKWRNFRVCAHPAKSAFRELVTRPGHECKNLRLRVYGNREHSQNNSLLSTVAEDHHWSMYPPCGKKKSRSAYSTASVGRKSLWRSSIEHDEALVRFPWFGEKSLRPTFRRPSLKAATT